MRKESLAYNPGADKKLDKKQARQEFVDKSFGPLTETLNKVKGEVTKAMSNATEVMHEQKTKHDKEMAILREKAMFDGLTGFLNTSEFALIVKKIVAELKEKGETEVMGAITFLDLDNFKLVNDTYGHDVGDIVLQAAADELKKRFGDSDLYCRYGGEEFVVYSPGQTAEQVLKKLDPEGSGRASIKVKAKLPNIQRVERIKSLNATFSGGITDFLSDEELGSALKRADETMYRVKKSGKKRMEIAHGPDGSSIAA
jgi:diguanylate cyclase